MTKKFFAIEDRPTLSVIIMDDDNRHFETLVLREGEVDETWDQFMERVSKRINYLNSEHRGWVGV